jgi:hypothetical protein
MRSSLALAFAFALALVAPGCTDLAGHAPTVVERCQAATNILFREDSAFGNRSAPPPITQSFATLLNVGVWTRASFNVTPQNGTGNWSAPARVLHNITLEDAKVEFSRAINAQSVHDVNVTYAIRRTLAPDEFATFCAALADLYPNVGRADEALHCTVPQVTTLWRSWLDGTERDRSAACGGALNETHAFIAAVDALKAKYP